MMTIGITDKAPESLTGIKSKYMCFVNPDNKYNYKNDTILFAYE